MIKARDTVPPMKGPAVRLRVPATSANLGPGFDCLGLALDLHLVVEARPAEQDAFCYRGEGRVPETSENLMHRGYRAACVAAGVEPAPVAFDVDNPIPLARGLGSSSAALVAGAAAADRLLGGPLGRDGVFALTAAIEGHPDNVAPAIYGGFTVSAPDAAGRYLTSSMTVPGSWRILVAIPPFELPTEKARALLPDGYGRMETVTTAARAALWTAAVASDRPELLRAACLDVLHQPHRAPLIPGFSRCLEEALSAGAYAAFLSGAGPAVGAVAGMDEREGVRLALQRFAGEEGKVLELAVADGYEVTVPNIPGGVRPPATRGR